MFLFRVFFALSLASLKLPSRFRPTHVTLFQPIYRFLAASPPKKLSQGLNACYNGHEQGPFIYGYSSILALRDFAMSSTVADGGGQGASKDSPFHNTVCNP